jgi:protein TonB
MDEKHWRSYLSKNLELDALAIDSIPDGIYKVTVLFIINKEGCITDVKLVNDPGYGLGIKVIKTIYLYDGKCIPSVQNGRKVKAYIKQEITFVIEEESCKEISPNGFIL